MKTQILARFYHKARIDILQEDNEMERLLLFWQNGFHGDNEFVKVSEKQFGNHGKGWAIGQIQYRDHEKKLDMETKMEKVGEQLLEPLGKRVLSPFVKR